MNFRNYIVNMFDIKLPENKVVLMTERDCGLSLPAADEVSMRRLNNILFRRDCEAYEQQRFEEWRDYQRDSGAWEP